MENIFQVVLYAIVALFVVMLIYGLGVTVLGGYVKPLVDELNPNSTVSITGSQYSDIAEKPWNGFKWAFYIIVSGILLFVGVKLFYQREETSQYYG